MTATSSFITLELIYNLSKLVIILKFMVFLWTKVLGGSLNDLTNFHLSKLSILPYQRILPLKLLNKYFSKGI